MSTNQLPGTYQSICVLYDRMPEVVLTLNSNNTFSYRLPYIEDKIEGTWTTDKDSLVLTSDYFSNFGTSEPMTPIRKYTDVPGKKDIFIIRGKKLYAANRKGELKKSCYLEKLK
jgi:hypothetical protein